MARRRGSRAETVAEQEHRARWCYLLRHPQFREELNEVVRLHHSHRGPSDEGQIKRQRLKDKWALDDIPSSLLYPNLVGPPDAQPLPELTQDTVELYENAFNPIPPPVLSWWGGPGYEDEFQPAWEKGELSVTLNVNYPLDLTLGLVEGEIRRRIEERREAIDEMGLKPQPQPSQRRRPDKADSHLAVWDRFARGETFDEIHKALGKPVSTIKSALLVAADRIGAPVRKKTKTIPLTYFDPETHMRDCKVCNNPQRLEDMCVPARLYVNLDYKAQRERTGRDTVKEKVEEESATAEAFEAPGDSLE